MDKHTVIIKPIISEKSMKDDGKSRYTFVVRQNASKTDIKKSLERLYNVHVTSLGTTIVKGRGRRVGPRRLKILASGIKKAVVTVKEGEKIDLFGGGENA